MISFYRLRFSIVCFLSYLVILISGSQNRTPHELTVYIEYGENDTFILNYKLVTNYSYYITFRLFANKQLKFGLFSPTTQYQQNSIEIPNQYETSTELFYLFIICFYFLLPSNEIDVQCRDKRLLKDYEIKPHDEHNASYKPLFLPLMYALSIIMLLPVIIQHRRRKNALSKEREKQLKRLSLTIAQDSPAALSTIIRKGNKNLKQIPIQLELVSSGSVKTILDDMDENDKVRFTIQNVQPIIDTIDYDDDDDDDSEGDGYDDNDIESDVTADECIAHLLNNAPWNSSVNNQSSVIRPAKKHSREVLQEQKIPMIIVSDSNNQERTIVKSNTVRSTHSFNINPVFLQS